MNSQEFAINPTHDFDTAILAPLARNLAIAQKCDLANPLPEELIDFSKTIRLSLSMLHRQLKEVRILHSELVDHLVSSHLVDAELGADLSKRAQSSQNPSSADVSDVVRVWQTFIEIGQKFALHNINPFTRDNADEGCVLALQLAYAIDWLSSAIALLTEAHSLFENAHTISSSALRLSGDILVIIFELLAEDEAPSATSLGWIRLSHVCGVWRQTLLDLPSLWARDAYVFGASIATEYLLPRARNSLLSISSRRLPSSRTRSLAFGDRNLVALKSIDDIEAVGIRARKGLLVDLHASVLCGWYQAKETDPCSSIHLLQMLEGVLRGEAQAHLRSVNIQAQWWPEVVIAARSLLPMALHPNLQHIKLDNVFIPFALSGLVSLHIVRSTHPRPSVLKGMPDQPPDMRMPQIWFDALLDSVESCPALTDFRVIDWLLPPPSNPRTINIARLDTFCCTDDSLLELLVLPALQQAHIIVKPNLESLRTALNMVFSQRYGPTPQSMHLSQRVNSISQQDLLIISFGRVASRCPPLATLPFDTKAMLAKPGPNIVLEYPVDKQNAPRPLTRVFARVSVTIRETLGTEALETLGFDSETREHTFHASRPTLLVMPLPSFPSVQTIDLPIRDKHMVHHALYSLGTRVNVGNLPLLSRIRFGGSLCAAEAFMASHQSPTFLLRARAAPGTVPITSLEYELSLDVASASLEPPAARLERLKQVLQAAVSSKLGDRTSLTMQDETAFDSQTGRTAIRLVVTILYHTPASNP